MVGENIVSLKAKYVKVGEIKIRRGKTHDYLRMTCDFSKPGKFTLDMENYLKE